MMSFLAKSIQSIQVSFLEGVNHLKEIDPPLPPKAVVDQSPFIILNRPSKAQVFRKKTKTSALLALWSVGLGQGDQLDRKIRLVLKTLRVDQLQSFKSK